MIIHFQVGPELISVKVTPQREFLAKGRVTNGEFIPFTELVRRSKQDGRAAEITERRMKCQHCLPTMDDVAWYINDEFRRFGAVCLKTEQEDGDAVVPG